MGREKAHELLGNLTASGVGKVLAEPRLAAFLESPGAPPNASGESKGNVAVEFRHNETTVRIRSGALRAVNDAIKKVQLEVAVDQKRPQTVAGYASAPLRLSSTRTIEASAELDIGEGTLLIFVEPARTVGRTILIAITPTQLVSAGNADLNSKGATTAVLDTQAKLSSAKEKYDYTQRLMQKGYAGQSAVEAARAELSKAASDLQAAASQAKEPADVEALRKRIKDLEDEIRALRDMEEKNRTTTPNAPARLPARTADVSRALLQLDVREAEVDLTAARSAYDEAADANTKVNGSVPAREFSARKLAVQKAEIALERAKLRLQAADPADRKEKGGQSSTSNLPRHEAANLVDPKRVPEGIQQKALARLNMKLAPIDALGLANGRFRGGMQVIEIVQNGLAEAAGIRVGDILTGLGVYELVRVEDLAHVLDHWPGADGQPLQFYVMRGNDVLQGKLTSNRIEPAKERR
jgi:hypothetical protein